MTKYYTRACNFYYGNLSIKLVKTKKTFPIGGSKNISFDQIEIFSREKKENTNKNNQY
jgi:dihydropteroate synthase